MSTDVVVARPMSVPVGQEVDAIARIANNLAQAGIYKKTAKTPQEVFAILLAARDMGVAPTSALAGGIHMVDGKPEVSANLQAQLLREYRGPEGQRYDYRVLTAARDRSKECHLEFRRMERGGEWETIGEEFFGMEDAQRASLAQKQVWKAYPKMMLLARCLSDGIASHCPETARGLRVYGEGEIGGKEPGAPLDGERQVAAGAPAAPTPAPEPEPVDAEVVPERVGEEEAQVLLELLRELGLPGRQLKTLIASIGAPSTKIDEDLIRSLSLEQATELGEKLAEIIAARDEQAKQEAAA